MRMSSRRSPKTSVPTFTVQCYQPAHRLFSLAGLLADDRLLSQDDRVPLSGRGRGRPTQGRTASQRPCVRPRSSSSERRRSYASLEWEGIFQVQLLERDGGQLSLIDFNPRPYASLGLDTTAGANVAAIWCDWLLGRDHACVTANPGYRYRWEERPKVQHLVLGLWHRRFREAAAVLRPRRRVVHAHFQLTDPAPLAARMLYPRVSLRLAQAEG